MSINVYLKEEVKVEEMDGYEKRQRRPQKAEGWDEYYIGVGLQLHKEKGRWYFILHEATEPIPSIVKDAIDEISFSETFPNLPRRATGIYEHKDAKAELDWTCYDRSRCGIKIRSKNMEDLLALYRMVRAGTIVPEPENNWEAEQAKEDAGNKEGSSDGLRQQIACLEDELRTAKAWRQAAVNLKLAVEGSQSWWLPNFVWRFIFQASVKKAIRNFPEDSDR